MAMFRDHMSTIGAWFAQWNECEQTVAIYSLLKRIAPRQARFLMLVLERSLADCSDLQRKELQANNPAFISNLGNDIKETTIQQLLLHLPLLHPGNSKAKACYLSVIPKILNHAVDTGVHVEEARQMVSYSAIHPAFTVDERKTMALWMRHIEERISIGSNSFGIDTSPRQSFSNDCKRDSDGWYHPSSILTSPPPNGINQFETTQNHGARLPPNGQSTVLHVTTTTANSLPSSQATQTVSNFHHPRVRRSNSLTPPVNVHHSDGWNSQDDLSAPPKQRSFSFSLEHAPLSPQNSLASSGSGSDSHLDDPRTSFNTEGSGMKDVPQWLKSLRLHKYVSLFSQMTYEDMMEISEAKLESQGVTKGARHKIALSIGKLKDRQKSLQLLEKDVVEGCDVRTALGELKQAISTPIKPFQDTREKSVAAENEINEATNTVADGDLAGQFTRVMGKVCSQLLMATDPDGESMGGFLCLVDRCIQHEAFTQVHNKKLLSWRHRVQDARKFIPPHRFGSICSAGPGRRHSLGRWNNFNGQDALFLGSSNTSHHPRNYSQNTHQHTYQSQLNFRFPGPFNCIRNRNLGGHNFNSSGFTGNLAPGSNVFKSGSNNNTNNFNSSIISIMSNKRPSLQEPLLEPPRSHAAVHRTKSAPSHPGDVISTVIETNNFSDGGCNANTGNMDPEIARLESLCLSMTEIALGGPGDM